MKKTNLIFLISTVICGSSATVFWYLSENSNDIRYLSDYFFLSGVSFFILGTIMALWATSRWHYYRHLKKKWLGKESEKNFDAGEKERKKQMLIGASIAFSGIVYFVFVCGYFYIKIGY